MADNTVSTQFTADATQAKVGANEAAQAVSKSAQSQTESINKIGKATQFLQSTLAKIFIPAAIATGLVRIAEGFIKVQKEAAQAQEQIDKTNKSLIDIANQDVFGLNTGDDLAEAQKKATAEIRKQAEAQSELIKKRQDELRLLSLKDRAVFEAQTGRTNFEEVERLEEERNRIFANSARAQAAAVEKIERDYAEKKRRDQAKADEQAAAVAKQKADEAAEREEEQAQKRQELYERQLAEFEEFERKQTEIAEDEAKKRTEALIEQLERQRAAYEQLQGAIQSVAQANQQASQAFSTGFGSDIKAIRSLLEVRGGWKK
jgi:hypothetical protein